MKIRLAAAFAAMLAIGGGARAAHVNPAEYCVAAGGTVQTRIPEFGTNGTTPLALDYPKQFCQWISPTDQSQIDVQLETLVAQKPTLAVLAYYAKVHVNLHKCKGGPGSCYCSDVGGTDEFGGINLSGGGWVLNSNATDVLDVCVFPDESAIDAYGLFYHAYGIIRGVNLKNLFLYKDPY